MKTQAKGQLSPMDKLTAGYEDFIKDKKVKKTGKQAFKNVVKKAAKPKARGSK